jgi:hypothetical protein
MTPRAAATAYFVAIAATAVATLLRWLLDPWMGWRGTLLFSDADWAVWV